MGLRYANQSSGVCFFVTTTFKDWNRYGNRPGVYEELAKSLTFCLSKFDACLFGYVLMPSHLHIVIGIVGTKLGPFMRDFKKFTAQKAAPDLGIKTSQLWMPRYDRVDIVSPDVLRTKLNYIHQNPVKEGLCLDPSNWKWSSAGSYEGGKTEIPIWTGWY